MSDIELKPCPFCGGKAQYYYQMENECIVCDECGARLMYLDFGEAHDKLVKQWNTRPIEDALQAENERLKKELDDLLRADIKKVIDYALKEGIIELPSLELKED